MKLATFAERNRPGAPRLGVGLIDLEKTAATLEGLMTLRTTIAGG
jgi:hypothetical protein